MPGILATPRKILRPPRKRRAGEAVSDQWYCMASHKPHKHHTARGRAPKAPSPTAFGKEG